jgi:FkbM family methyltransferase
MGLKYALKKFVQQSAKRLGYRLERIRDTPAPIDVFSLVMEHELRSDPNFFVVQIGANDGLTDDPIREFVIRHRLRGLLVEPQPVVFRRLQENYKDQPQLAFENVAVSAQAGTARLYTAGADGRQDYLASFDPEVIRKHLSPGYRVEHIDVPTVQLSELLKKHGVRHVSLLQIDTEGYDYEVVKMIEFGTLKPTVVHFEHVHLRPADYEACVGLLVANGYRLLAQRINTIAYLQPTPAGT